MVYDYVNLVIYSSITINTEIFKETDIFIRTKAISQVIFDPNIEFLILFNSDVIYKYYYPKTGLLINKEILLKF